MARGSRSGFSFGRIPFCAGQAGLLLGFKPGSRSLPRLALLFGATARFARFLILGRDASQCRSLGGLFGAQSVVCEICGAFFGFCTFPGQTRKVLLLGSTSSGRICQFRGRKLATLGIGQRTLFRLDFRTQRYFGQPFDMRLLRGGGLSGGLSGSAPQSLLRRNLVGLHASLRRNNVFCGLHLARFSGSPSTFVGGGARQGFGFGSSLGIQLVSSGHAASRDLATLPLQVHQSRQDFAQIRLPVQGKACEPLSGEPNPVPPRAEGRIDRWNPVKPAAKPC